jgi:UDP-GlcNAc:undecaprenyl-phosphate/decaprenyl-phosphate GlcNAc-1-phosphate transferase
MPPAIVLSIVACFLCLCVTPLVRDACLRRNVIDHPDVYRKRHKRAVPRLGGVGIVFSYSICLVLGTWYFSGGSRFASGYANGSTEATVILVPFVCIFAVGLYDDLSGLTAVRKLGLQLVVAVIAVAAGFRFSLASRHWAALMACLSIFWLVACMNAFNLIDGLDGLASGIGALMGAAAALAGLLLNDPALITASLLLCGTLVGFLRFNINPASIFLGDSGSLTIGLTLGCFSILWSNHAPSGGASLAPILIWTVPLLDLILSVLRRSIRGVSLFSADRGHIHHQLLERGFSTTDAALNLCIATAFGGVAGILVCFASAPVALFAALMLAMGVFWGVWKLRYAEFGAVSSLLNQISWRKFTLAHITLINFAQAISRTEDVEEYWRLLKTACREFGCFHIHLMLNGQVFEEELQTRSLHPYWTLTFPVSGKDLLTLRTNITLKTQSPSFSLFLETVQNDLSARYQRRRSMPAAAAALSKVQTRSLAANT